MRRSNWFRGSAMLLLALVPVLVPAARADTVTEWNAHMQTAVTTVLPGNPSNPNLQTRWDAITQLAVFEAVNAIEGDYEPYLGGLIVASPGASVDAAVIVAAYDTLLGLRPAVVDALDLDLVRDADLAAIPDGDAKQDGIEVGHAAAVAMLALRVGDGWDTPVPYEEEPAPGIWQPLPGQTPFLPGWGQVTTFGIESGSQFRLPPPPGLRTGKYAVDFNEVKLLGRVDSPYRPQDRTDVAKFYAAASPVVVWNSAARQASAAQGQTLSENARIFALLGMAMADAGIAGWDTKYHYNFWRPQMAIQAADTDGNDLTDKDETWLPLIPTPAHPSYASGHATVSGSARTVMEWAFGKDGHDVTLTLPSQPGIVLDYSSWEEITDDIDDARIYGGIHWRFDQEAGAHQGRQVGKYILRNLLRSLDEELDDLGDDQ